MKRLLLSCFFLCVFAPTAFAELECRIGDSKNGNGGDNRRPDVMGMPDTTNPQTHNNQGNPYSGLLADFMGVRNAPQPGQSTIQR